MIQQRLCSPSRDGQELLPQLVGKLITASIPVDAIREYRFPHGDQVYLHGEDGILAVETAVQHLYVPGGISVWEMGTESPPRAKANKDFAGAAKKLANAFPNVTPAVTPDKATAVFVTSATFQDHGKWVRKKRQNSAWKSIKVIDAVTLASWLEQCPSVMLWFAEVCSLPAEGLFDAEQYLRRLGVAFGLPAVSPELVVAAREDEVGRLRDAVLQSNAEVHVRGESIEEAAGFLAAAALKQADKFGEKPPLVFANSHANLTLLATFGAELTLVPLDSEAIARAKSIPGQKWRLIVPDLKTPSPASTSQVSVTLGPCKRTAIEQHLTQHMKVPEHRARQIARDTKGSLIALLWLVGSGPVGAPRWASRKDATTHASLILAGSWTGNNASDTRAIERLSRKEYRDIETLLQSALIPEGPWIHRGTEWLCASREFVWGQLIGKVTETMLTDFREVVREVVGEEDPSLDVSPSERHMASILGKTRKFSGSLRKGLMDSVARLALLRTDGQAWADRIARDLLDPDSPKALNRWLSLVDVYSEIAEASPVVFLDCLDAMVRQGNGEKFFQDIETQDFMFGPFSAHVFLLWALERLAWQKECFPRVLSILARLAELDPGGKTSNRPQNSLITILLPWSPQHSETMDNAAATLDMLHTTSAAVAWDVAAALLPTSWGTTSGTPTPTYRPYGGDRKVTGAEYWDFVRTVVEKMTEWAGDSPERWARLVEAYPDVRRGYPEVGVLITDALGRIDTAGLAEDGKAVIHDSLRKLATRHREHDDAEWALPESDLKLLEGERDRFAPDDAVLRCRHLFSWDPDVPDAPMRQYESGWDEWIGEKRAQAAKAVYEGEGISGLSRLAEHVVLPECVGQAAARVGLSPTEEAELVQKTLFGDPSQYGDSPLMQLGRGYVWAKCREAGEEWLRGLLGQQGIGWTPEGYANLALACAPSPELWTRLAAWGGESERLYWGNVELRLMYQEQWPWILDKWREVNRPWSALELIADLVDERHADEGADKPSADVVMGVLEEALDRGETVEPQRRKGAMLGHHVEAVFLYLDTQDVDPKKLASLEWGWLRILEDTNRGAKLLQSQVTSSPELFVELLKAVYRAEGEPDSEVSSDEQGKVAEQAFHLLERIHTVPGFGDVGARVDAAALWEWVRESRRLAQEVGRLQVCDSKIGQILSHSPKSPDGSWPCQEVRDVIEEVQSPRLENGLRIGKYNQRGAFFRGKGGKQEWDLAKEYKTFADQVRVGWPRTAAVLDGLAKGYEAEARHWDEQAQWEQYE